jgi:integrase
MLWVRKGGGRSWVQRLTINGKRRDIGLGPYPLVTLAAARELAVNNKRQVLSGRDPVAVKKKAQAEARKRINFAEASKRACEELSPSWRGKKEPQAFINTLAKYANPYFGSNYLEDIEPADIRKAILACRAKVPNQATKVQHRILSVFKWAVAEGLRADNPATSDALALPKHERQTKNSRALPYQEVVVAIDKVKASRAWSATKMALEFTILTAARSGEARGACWSEIDVENAVWTVPAQRMKMNREHRVPLSKRAMEVLEEARTLDGNTGLVFPSFSGRELSDNTLSKLLRELELGTTVHGFRSSFRTWTQEQTNAPSEVGEAALAHVKADKVEAAYARSDLFEKRRRLMDSWSSYLNEEFKKL